MKTPEEIKKGLELCVNGDSYDYPCDECPYVEEEDRCKSMMADALAYIQQLETANSELIEKNEWLRGECYQLNCVVSAMRSVRTCETCLHKISDDQHCYNVDYDCYECNEECQCKFCQYGSNWERC